MYKEFLPNILETIKWCVSHLIITRQVGVNAVDLKTRYRRYNLKKIL